MTVYVCITDSCAQDAQQYGVQSQLENIRLTILDSQKLTGFTPYRPTKLLKKNMGRTFRLLAYNAQCNNAKDALIILLKVLPRGHSDYDYLLDHHETHSEQVTAKFFQLNREQITDLYAIEVTNSESVVEPLPELSEREKTWLSLSVQPEDMNHQDDLLVLESQHWVKEMSSDRNRDYLASCQSFLENLDPSTLETSASIDDIKFHSDPSTNIGILYSIFPGQNQLLLWLPIIGKKENDNIEVTQYEFQEYIETQIKESEFSAEDMNNLVKKFARNVYPYYMILDSNVWRELQKNKEANLALSPEEADLLNSIRAIRASQFSTSNYPIFINGRAGSGKSTILQYLMADFINLWLKNKEFRDLHPLYMTYSPDLRKSARDGVRRLLKTKAEKLLERFESDRASEISNLDAEVEMALKESFVVFHDFLLEKLPDYLKQKFSDKKFINYTKFRQLWNSPQGFITRRESKKINVDIAWHVIRSYIKGMRSLDDEDPVEAFAEIPKKRRSITLETYELVYEKVWQGWYKPLSEKQGYWDDQDLVYTVLKSNAIESLEYAAILCDEAQDFTSIELEFILQISLFSKRKLDSKSLRQVPFIFAGDPLQTLNPTGFRWEDIQANFYDRFSSILDPTEGSNINITYQELKFNYRSNPGIVKFCNLLQLVRLCLVQSKSLAPQEAWWIDKKVQIVWLDINDIKTQDQIQKRTDITKIVNCDLGGETYFVESDPILSQIEDYEESDSGKVFPNILSPARAKGLEFDSVIVYRFAESPPDRFTALLEPETSIDNPEELIPYEYFLNRLYVAASRAKKQLIIVESKENIEKLWKFATDANWLNKMGGHLKNLDVWNDNKIAYLHPGTHEAWTGKSVDLLVQAVKYKTQGLSGQDPYLLRQAALCYKSLSELDRYTECSAIALEIEDKFQEAGDLYQKAGQYQKAFDSYWKGKKFASINQLIDEYTSLSGQIKARVSQYMERTHVVPPALITQLDKFLENQENWMAVRDDTTWHVVFQELAHGLNQLSKDRNYKWRQAYRLLKQCHDEGIDLREEILGNLAYRAKQYETAAGHFENAGMMEANEYYECQALLQLFPDRLIWLHKLDRLSKIYEEWKRNPQIENKISGLDRNILIAVREAAKHQQDCQLMLLMMYHDRERSRAEIEWLILESLQQQKTEIANVALTWLVRSLIQQKLWQEAIDLVQGADTIQLPHAKERSLVKQHMRKEGVSKLLVRAAAIAWCDSTELSEHQPEDERVDERAIVSDFLYKRFIEQRSHDSVKNAGLSLKVVGAAIERAGKIVNALQFYGNLSSYRRLSPEESILVNQRRIANLERRALYLRSRNQSNQAEECEFRARSLRKRMEIGSERLPEYPEFSKTELDDLKKVFNPSLDSNRTSWNYGELTCKCSPNRERWQVSHNEDLQDVKFSLSQLQMSGDAAFTLLTASNSGETHAWRIESWETTIRIFKLNSGVEICITTDNCKPLRIMSSQ